MHYTIVYSKIQTYKTSKLLTILWLAVSFIRMTVKPLSMGKKTPSSNDVKSPLPKFLPYSSYKLSQQQHDKNGTYIPRQLPWYNPFVKASGAMFRDRTHQRSPRAKRLRKTREVRTESSDKDSVDWYRCTANLQRPRQEVGSRKVLPRGTRKQWLLGTHLANSMSKSTSSGRSELARKSNKESACQRLHSDINNNISYRKDKWQPRKQFTLYRQVTAQLLANKMTIDTRITRFAEKHGLSMVSPSPSKSKKPKENDAMDLTNTGDKENDEPMEMFPDDGFVSTAPNSNMFDITVQFPDKEDKKKSAKEAYKGLFGEGEGYAHDDIPRLMRLVTKVLEEQKTPAKSKYILSLEEWALGCSIIGRNDDALDGIDADVDEIIQAKVIMSKLAHTSPGKMFGSSIKRSKTPSTNQSRAWYAAVFVLGSQYKKKNKGQKQAVLNLTGNKLSVEYAKETSNEVKSSKTNKKKGKSTGVSFLEMDDELEEDEDTNTKTKGKEEMTSRKAMKQRKIANVPRGDRTRLLMKIYVPGTKGISPTATFLKIFKSLMEAIQEDDETTQLLPWDMDSSKNTLLDVYNMDKFPSTKAEFMPYTNSLRLRNNANVWVSTQWACDTNSMKIASNNPDCGVDWWYDEHQGAAYPCTVQNSAHAVDVADFLYSGGFLNCGRLIEQIQLLCRDKYKKEFKIGARVKMLKELQDPDKERRSYKAGGHWALDDSKVIHLEADREEADALMVLLKSAFKTKIPREQRPGLYEVRLMPEKNFVKAGSSGSQDRMNMLKKHQAIIQSLGLVSNNQVKFLDTEAQCNHTRYTLRSLLMELTFPLVLEEGVKKEYLIHSVDFAESGNDKKAGKIYVTAYNDRVDLVQRLVNILPKFVEFILSKDVAKMWFHATAIAHAPDVNFETDDSGNWNGAWTTEDDEQNQEVLAEDMGIKFEGLDFMGAKEQVIMTTDDASMQSFGMSFGMIKQSKMAANKTEADADSGSNSVTTQEATVCESSGRSDE